MAENNTSNIGFEKQIWDAACVLRGNIDASDFLAGVQINSLMMSVGSMVRLLLEMQTSRGCST